MNERTTTAATTTTATTTTTTTIILTSGTFRFLAVWGFFLKFVYTPTSWGEFHFIVRSVITHSQISRPMTLGYYTFVEFGLP